MTINKVPLSSLIGKPGGPRPSPSSVFITNFVKVDEVAPPLAYESPTRTIGPIGAAYVLTTETDAAGSSLYARAEGLAEGKYSVYGYVRVRNPAGASSLPKAQRYFIDVPSGALDNAGTIDGFAAANPLDCYCHPSIAYDPVGVAGYKYWCIASILPGYSTGGALWEDEDIFVSNDGRNWKRILSPYEPAKSYGAPGLSLPPHSLANADARRFQFLPCPAAGDTIEISVPADNGGAALDRVNITLTGFPWKHDPAILIDSGYVYVYHSFHLPYADRTGGKNRFVVCARTSDGVNWECVRSDGSTMPLDTAEASRQMFTKDAEGRYNFLLYKFNTAWMNPEVIKCGDGDYEFVYGANFTTRFKGTTPWDFDFSTPHPFQNTSSFNHPGLLNAGGKLYLLNERGLYESENRGQAFTQLPSYPVWVGGITKYTYKKALCIGDGGKVVVVDTKRIDLTANQKTITNQYRQTKRGHKMFTLEYPSIEAFLELASDGIQDAWIDVQCEKVNRQNQTLKSYLVNYVGNVSTTTGVNTPHQRVKIFDCTVGSGDEFHFYIGLVARNGSTISFNGIEIERNP